MEVAALGPLEYYIMGLILTVEAILGTICCVRLLLVYLKNPTLHQPQSLLGITLCIGDLGIALMCPFAAFASFSETWPFGDEYCQLYAFTGMLFGTLSISAMACLALDKCYSSSNDAKGGSSQPYILITSIIWLNALFWSLTPLSPIGWGRYAIEPPKSTCMLDFANREPSYMMYLFLMASTVYALPVGAILWCLVKLRKGKDPNNGKSKVCLLVLFSLIVYWGAYGIVALWAALDDIHNVPLRLVAAAPILAKICPIGNTVMQVLTNRNIRCLMYRKETVASNKRE
ncbi:RPE-retinal G protein-coupled receptor-like [Asterias rubens]|uniref:RPE-retinal G protein-coupled receptor-like n=1 Tax=Asterias rubens TaxID=7604 RepID=UPI001455A03B|nr:RPE-retinal G protein-coupled receptor-like [Asterias rubens]XP_033643707.1 RPE-retinal G protein-coupled receptor-like [Asterias rubens]